MSKFSKNKIAPSSPNHCFACGCCDDDRNNNIGGDQYFGKPCRPKVGLDRGQRNHQSGKYHGSQDTLQSNNIFLHCDTGLRSTPYGEKEYFN